MDKLENKLIDMRDLYGDGKEHVSYQIFFKFISLMKFFICNLWCIFLFSGSG